MGDHHENGDAKPIEAPPQLHGPQQPQMGDGHHPPSGPHHIGEHKPPQHHQQQQQQQQQGPPPPARDDVCRDYLKNICNRGSRCKFYHPSEAPLSSEQDYNFCIDYQNRGCQRDNCRFVHAPRDEVERYKTTRELTLILARAIAAVGHGDTIGGIPICKEFQTGRCARGVNRCRYWHVNVDLERERRSRGLPPTNEFAQGGGGGGGHGGGGRGFPPPPPPYGGGGGGMGRRRPFEEYDQDPIKRPRYNNHSMEAERILEVEKRNAELQKECDSLRRELAREHERYEDLYALFRQQSGGAPAPPKNSAASAAAVDYYASWNSKTPGGW